MRQQAYADSLSVYNKGEQLYKNYLNFVEKNSIPESSLHTLVKDEVIEGDVLNDYFPKEKNQPIQGHGFWYDASGKGLAPIVGTNLTAPDVRRELGKPYTPRYKKPVQPIEIRKPSQKLTPKEGLLLTSQPELKPNTPLPLSNEAYHKFGNQGTMFSGNFNFDTGEWSIKEDKPVQRYTEVPEGFKKGGVKSYLKGGFIKKYQYQTAGEKLEDDKIINDSIPKYGKNSREIQSRVNVQPSANIPQELLQEFENIQSQINQGYSKRTEYEKNVLNTIGSLKNIDVARTAYMPENIKQAAIKEKGAPMYCISGVCYTLNEAGEDIKYFSNNALQQDITSGKLKDWELNYDTKNIKGGDIVQFLRNTESGEGVGGPHHAALVVPDSIKNNDDGTITFDAYMNDGSGRMFIREGYTLDPKTDVVLNSSNKEKIQLVSKKFDTDSSQLLSKRDQIKAKISELDPTYFEPKDKVIRYNTYSPEQIEETALGTSLGDRDLSSISRVGGGDVLDKVGKMIGKNMPYQEFSDKAQIKQIVSKVNNPDFKKDFMERYNISNEEYNAAVKTAIGVYGQETAFGFKPKKLKENDFVRGMGARLENVGRIISKKEKRSTDKDSFSRGLTQIKFSNISKEDREKYGVNYKSVESDPTSAVIGAMIVNAQNMPTLRKIASDKRNAEVTEENYLDYLPYLYNQRQAILSGDEKNKERAAKKAKRYKGDVAKAMDESTIKNPNSIGANNQYVKNVNEFGELVEILPVNMNPVEIKQLGGSKKCYTCEGLKAKVGYNKLGYKK
jgi:hypothetical protein